MKALVLTAVGFISVQVSLGQSESSLSRAVFETSFRAGVDARAFQATFNGGGFKAAGDLEVLSPGSDRTVFPYLLTRPEMLPTEGDWVASVDFCALSAAQNGNGFALHNTTTGSDLFRVHVDREVGMVQLWLGNGKSQVLEDSAWDGSPMKVTLDKNGRPDRWSVRKEGSTMTLTFDGKTLIAVTPEAGQYALRLGIAANARVNDGEWSRIGYRSVRIDYVTAKPPQWLR